METKERVSLRQFTILVALYSIGTSILIIPASLAAIAKQDGWIAALLGIGVGLLLAWLYSAVGDLYPEKSLYETIERILGKWIGKAIILFFAFFCTVTAAEVIYFIGNFITTQILHVTPMQYINILFVLVVAMGIHIGIESVARSSEILFPVFIFLFAVLVVFVTPQVHIERIQPLFEIHFKSMVWATMYFASVFSFTPVLLLMVYPGGSHGSRKARRGYLIGTVLAGIVLTLIILLCTSVLGADMTGRQMYPSYALAKKINVGQFLNRIEIVMAILWFITIFYRVSFYFYGAIMGLKQVFNLKNYRSLVLPLSMVIAVLSLIVNPDIAQSEEYNRTTWLPFVSTFGFWIPVLLLVVHAFRRKK